MRAKIALYKGYNPSISQSLFKLRMFYFTFSRKEFIAWPGITAWVKFIQKTKPVHRSVTKSHWWGLYKRQIPSSKVPTRNNLWTCVLQRPSDKVYARDKTCAPVCYQGPLVKFIRETNHVHLVLARPTSEAKNSSITYQACSKKWLRFGGCRQLLSWNCICNFPVNERLQA